MNTVCGWYTNYAGFPRDYLEPMLRAVLPDGSRHDARNGDQYALACGSRNQAHNIAEKNGCYAVITGRPYWHDEKLASIANINNHASALLIAYLDQGEHCLDSLQGNFALAIIDPGQRKLLLAIDRIGNEALHYTSINDGIAFASRAASLLTLPDISRELNQQALYNYLYFHAIPSPKTVYQGLNKLAPGHYLVLQDNNVSTHRYWSPDFAKSRESLTQLESRLHSILRRSLQRSAPDSNTGAFLSGGVDSSTISGVLAETQDQAAKTFSIGFDAKEYNEIEYARLTSKHFKTQLHEYFVTPQDVVDIVPRIAEYYDEPFGNSSAVPVYYCAKLAKDNGVSLMLAGDGGDELFAGNEHYRKQQIFGVYDKTPGFVKYLLQPMIQYFPGGQYIMPIRKARSYIEQARVPMPERLETYNMLHHFDAKSTFTEEFYAQISESVPIKHMQEQYFAVQSGSMLDRMLLLDWKQTLADNDLRKVNGMCDLAGIDVSYPLLDDELLEFSMSVPDKMKIKGNQLRYFFKHAMRNFLPQGVLSKSKHGFGLPFGVWMRTHQPLQELAYDNIAALKQRHILKNDFLDQLVKLHREDHAAFYGEFIWVLMMLELWLSSHQH